MTHYMVAVTLCVYVYTLEQGGLPRRVGGGTPGRPCGVWVGVGSWVFSKKK